MCWLLLVSLPAMAQRTDDGPYLLEENGANYVYQLRKSKLFREELKGDQLKVEVPGRPEQDFTVELRGAHVPEPGLFAQPEKLFFISDLEGEFEGLRKLLLAAGIMDHRYDWTFGRGHLVICGDLFDRGRQVPLVLWLLYRLEAEATRHGGYVHTILGNHDIMNLSGDLRYLDKKYLHSAELIGRDYLSLYGRDTELGRWLRSKNVIEKIGDNLCLHAGIAPELGRLWLSVGEVNGLCRPYYDRAPTTKGVGDPKVDIFFRGRTSPFWYRGYFLEPKASQAQVDSVLAVFGGARLVVGHTIVKQNIGFYYGGRVLGIDVDRHRGDHRGAMWEAGNWWTVDARGRRRAISAI